jgi:hypothetical protein
MIVRPQPSNPLMSRVTTLALWDREPLYRRPLAIDEKSLGPDHPNVAIRLNNGVLGTSECRARHYVPLLPKGQIPMEAGGDKERHAH